MAEDRDPGREHLPPAVTAPLTEPVRDYWLHRVRQHWRDFYAGVPLSKFPEDLRVYEHLLWASRANVVIELGLERGGSALWFRDRLRTMVRYGRIADPLVIAVDVDTAPARSNLQDADPSFADQIRIVDGDVTDPALPEQVAGMLPPGGRCFVVEDTEHTYETTAAALRGFARFVPVGGFLVVEDGCVDVEEMRASYHWPRGVLPALHDWLETPEAAGFRVRRDLELYGVSCHPEGFLERVGPE